MLNNFTISQLSVELLLVSPFIAQTFTYEKAQFNTFFSINCMKSSFSFLYSKSNANVNFKQSIFSKFNGQCPILMNSQLHDSQKSSKFYKNGTIKIKEEEKDYYEGETIITTQFFYIDMESSVTFKQCSFLDCINDNSQGGAISFRKSYASLMIEECSFIRCKSYQSAGAIFVLQLLDGNWLIGDFSITNSIFEECNDCNGDIYHDYMAGVIEGSIGKGDKNYCFTLQRSELLNCEFNKKNRITEAQIRVSANIFHFNYCNVTNSNQKVDLSAIFFNKYVQEPSSITFLNAINQYGFSFFEIYNLESSFIEIKNANIINTTFVNYNRDELLTKVAFFNIYFEHENSLYVDNLFIVDFITIITDDEENQDYGLINPVIIQIPETSKHPITSNIYSNQIFDQTNIVNYIYIPTMRYDYDKQMIVGIPGRNDTSITDEIIIPTEITATHSNQFNYIINNIHDSTENKKLTNETFLVVLIVILIVLINVFVIIIVIIRKNSSLIHEENNEESDDEDETNEDFNEKNQLNDQEINHSKSENDYELFFNPSSRQKIISMSKEKMSIISKILKNEDLFKDDFEEDK